MVGQVMQMERAREVRRVHARHALAQGGDMKADEAVGTLKSLIERDYAQPLTLGTLAAAVGRERAYVARMFRRRTGDTLHGYLTAVRVARAREHILHGHKIEAVMLLVGYRSKKNFYRQFRAATGVTPGAYRDAHGWTQDA
jgi:YesN/AraC family two-component response regulator